MQRLVAKGSLAAVPLVTPVAAVSVGRVQDEDLLDLRYAEDSRADVDFNVVKTGKGGFVEVQGTAEGKPFSKTTLDSMLDMAGAGITQLFSVQREAIAALHVRG